MPAPGLKPEVAKRGLNMRYAACLISLAAILFAANVAAQDATYLGDLACRDCHESLYESFHTMSPKKSEPSEGFPKLLSDFTEEQRTFCYSCHVTGAGAPGGFVNFEETPEMGHVGCETCHGPGSIHAEFGDPADIIRHPGMEGCTACHNGDRVPLPKVYGRPHGLNQ